MTLVEFTVWLIGEVTKFLVNLSKNGFQPMSRKEWFKTFLAWMEWETEMHDEYWPEDES